MVTNLKNLSETVDRGTTDRKLADRIQDNLPRIREDIRQQGYSVVEIDGRTFKVTSAVEKK